jgi:segregation and condensation protein B
MSGGRVAPRSLTQGGRLDESVAPMTQPDDPTPEAPPSAEAPAPSEPALGTQAPPAAPSADAAALGEPSEPSELSESELERDLAALLFVSTEPLSKGRLATLVGGASEKRVLEALERLNARLASAGLPWELREIAGGWQVFTTPDVAETVALLGKAKKDEKLSGAGLETLAIVAYRQPVTKGEIEAIRGVQVGPILRTLVDRGMVKVGGRSDDPGHPLLYVTTRKFLDTFALASLDDLPRDGELLRD